MDGHNSASAQSYIPFQGDRNMEQREGGIWDSASPEGQTWIAAGLGAWTANGSLTSRAFIFVEAVVLRRVHLSLPQFVTTTSPSFLLPCLRPEFS